MRDLIHSNDPVLLSFAAVLLRDAGVEVIELDGNMSALEGSIGVLPRRIAVAEGDWHRARTMLRDAGLNEWVKSDEP
jgi:putative signal transducing protein